MPGLSISDHQRAAFQEDGYLLLGNAVPAPLLHQWQELAARLEQDAVAAHRRGEQLPGACDVGVYLDDAPAGDGCLRYVPGTQHQLVDIEDLSRKHGWDIPGVIEQPAKAGDILVQDMMILHGSQPKRSPGVRRTIYIELRPYQGILETADQSKRWGALRQQWMQLVLQRGQAGDWPAEWMDDYPPLEHSQDEVIRAIMDEHEPPTPAVWGTFPVETDDYPVPADLRD